MAAIEGAGATGQAAAEERSRAVGAQEPLATLREAVLPAVTGAPADSD